MLDNILGLVKDQVLPVINGNADIPEDKKEAVVETTTSTIFDSLKDQLIPDNLTEVMNLFGGGNSGASSFGSNVMVQGIQSAVSSALTQKIGLNSGIANTIATTVVPLVMNLFSDKVNDSNEPGFNVQSLIEAISGGSGNNKGGGLMGMLGSLFGK